MATVVDIVQRAARTLGIPKPQAVAGSSDPQVQQLAQVLLDEIEDAGGRHDWSVLKRSYTWTVGTTGTLVNGVATLPWPSDFGRIPAEEGIRHGRFWHVQRQQTLMGPVAGTDWDDMTSGLAGVLGAYWRPWTTGIQVVGATAADTIRFGYQSRFALTSPQGADQDDVVTDADLVLLPAFQTRLGVIWRWRQRKGLDYAEDLASYERELEQNTSFDGGLGTIAIGGSDEAGPFTLPSLNIRAS